MLHETENHLLRTSSLNFHKTLNTNHSQETDITDYLCGKPMWISGAKSGPYHSDKSQCQYAHPLESVYTQNRALRSATSRPHLGISSNPRLNTCHCYQDKVITPHRALTAVYLAGGARLWTSWHEGQVCREQDSAGSLFSQRHTISSCPG